MSSITSERRIQYSIIILSVLMLFMFVWVDTSGDDLLYVETLYGNFEIEDDVHHVLRIEGRNEYFISTNSKSFGNSSNENVMFKVSEDGTMIWSKSFLPNGFDYVDFSKGAVASCWNDTFVLAGSIHSGSSEKGFVMMVAGEGDVVFGKRIDFKTNLGFLDVYCTYDPTFDDFTIGLIGESYQDGYESFACIETVMLWKNGSYAKEISRCDGDDGNRYFPSRIVGFHSIGGYRLSGPGGWSLVFGVFPNDGGVGGPKVFSNVNKLTEVFGMVRDESDCMIIFGKCIENDKEANLVFLKTCGVTYQWRKYFSYSETNCDSLEYGKMKKISNDGLLVLGKCTNGVLVVARIGTTPLWGVTNYVEFNESVFYCNSPQSCDVEESENGYILVANDRNSSKIVFGLLSKNFSSCHRNIGGKIVSTSEFSEVHNSGDGWGGGGNSGPLALVQSVIDITMSVHNRTHETHVDNICWKCYGKYKNDEGVCSGKGNCISRDLCNCSSIFYSGEECERWDCYGIDRRLYNVCGDSNGTCIGHNDCDCKPGFVGDECKSFECNEIPSDDSGVCSGHGTCVSGNRCECYNETIYSPSGVNGDCSVWECFGKERNMNSEEVFSVCSGHGVCVDYDNCTCTVEEDYTGKECEYWACFGVPLTIPDQVCGGHGGCIAHDICLCMEGYFTEVFDDPCSKWWCDKYLMDDLDMVCNQHGECTSSHFCTCVEGYEGFFCESWKCGIDFDHPLTCSGNGVCVSPNQCECDSNYYGEFCEKNMLLLTVMTPILSSFGLGVILLMFVFCFMCLCVTVICVLLTVLLGGFILCCAGLVRLQKNKMKRFSRLRNVDLLIKEQELDEDTTIAHLRINKELFEIRFEDIETVSIIGEGGSNSIVFKANWSGKTVAFKCFKTRMVMCDQQNFNEFEREVEILGSLSHPFIIRFYGAALKVPRIGIVMEYASKGEILKFMIQFEELGGKPYPLEQKNRMFLQIAKSISYIHQRNIIHRDIKPENILICENEDTKLMDFGLSRLFDRMSMKKTSRVGTSVFMAPEVVLESSYTEKCDVFSFAILMYCLLTQDEHPYGDPFGDGEFQVELKVANNPNKRPDVRKLDYLDNGKYGYLKQIIERCWNHDPRVRYSFKELEGLLEGRRESESPSTIELNKNQQKERKDLVSGEHGTDLDVEELIKWKKQDKIEELKRKLGNSNKVQLEVVVFKLLTEIDRLKK